MLLHRGRPDRFHHESRHHHVPAEVGGEIRKPRHQFFLVTQQFRAPDLAIKPLKTQTGPPVHRVGLGRKADADVILAPVLLAGVKGDEILREYFAASQRGERRGIGGKPQGQ